MNTDNQNPNKSQRAQEEEKILTFWQDKKIFEKSLEKESPKGNYVFYDGPPFATGQMHYGHILGSTAKDAIGRYQTMQGYHVPRRWGWDCHGLPIENIVEKELGIAGHKEIEALGIDKFVEYARSKVLQYDKDWEKNVERIGRWVDFRGGYKTMDNTFIESVWWALDQLNQKELIYEGVRVLAYCSRCETPIANSEIAMDNSYKDITDISVYVKFELIDEPGTHLLAWTTTPWSLPGDTALAVNKDIIYTKVQVGKDILILAKDTVEKVLKDKEYSVLGEIAGSELVGKKYKPPFDYYQNIDLVNKENIWKVWHADFVSTEKGTGIAHEAPAFGEDDMNLAKENNIPWIIHVDETGSFKSEVTDFAGLKVKPKDTPEEKDAHQKTDIEIIKYLAHNGTLFAKEKMIHSYPHCMRCDTPIIYYALPSWFINIQKVKGDIMKQAETMNWIPGHLKDGRFKNSVESAPDWNISRNRFWASPLPIWKSIDGKIMFVSGLLDLKKKVKKSGNSYFVMRHGGTEGNEKGIVSYKDQATDHLTEKGKQQVRSEAGHYQEKFDLIIASPFTRTRETAEIVLGELRMNPDQLIFDERLREINPGEFDGKSWDEYHQFVYGIGSNWYEKKITDGESLQDVGTRIGEFLYELEEKYADKNILIVTHGGPAWVAHVVGGEYVPDNKEYHRADTYAFVKEFKRFQNGEIRKLDFTPLPHNATYQLDLHRPYVDAIKLLDETGEEYTRIPEVIDCWFESGSMPFAQDHYPFENTDWQEKNFPADFVAEYIAQTRTWFYYTLVNSVLLFGKAPFKNIVTTGTLRAEDGQKISKSKKNYPDPWIFIDKYGVDALRVYLMSGPLMKGEDANFVEKLVADIASKLIGRLQNVVAFYELYRDTSVEQNIAESKNVLDMWIMSRLNQLTSEVTQGMQNYDMAEATRPFDLFIDDLSTWYLRRSRDRLKDAGSEDSTGAKQTLYVVLKTLAQVMAPFTPFVAEEIWQKLKNEHDTESVHLENWPAQSTDVRFDILEEMQTTRTLVSFGLQARQKAGIAVRQPLRNASFKSNSLGEIYEAIMKDELNVKGVAFDKNQNEEVLLDTEITSELKAEGDMREFIRAVQDMRKKKGLQPSDIITLTVDTDEAGKNILTQFTEEIKKVVGAKDIVFAKNNGEEVSIDELKFTVEF